MIKVSKDVCESIVSQIENLPEQRVNDMVAKMIVANPEYVEALQSIFSLYINKNERDFGELPPHVVSALAANSILFAAIGWSMVQSQHDADELNRE